MKTGDIIAGNIRVKTQNEKFSALLYVRSVNGMHPGEATRRMNFEDMTPIFPNERLIMERPGGTVAMRIVDLISPIGKGQRQLIIGDKKTGKTVYLADPLMTDMTEEDEALAAEMENTPERFLRFPTKHEIHQYRIMEAYIDQLPPGKAQLSLIHI